MIEKLYLGVDIGTYETKGVLVNLSGEIISQSSKKHELIVPQQGWAEHRPLEDWWEDVIFITNDLIKKSKVNPKNIKSVSTSAIGPCMLPVDKEGNPLMNAILYGVDTRAYKEIKYLDNKIGKQKIIDFCGNALTSQSVGPKILWLKKNKPEIFKHAYKFLNSTSYINFNLTGHYVIDHFSAANTSPFYDIKKNIWSDELIDGVLKLNQLPNLFWSDEIIGTINSQSAKITGLLEGTPVTAGTIDVSILTDGYGSETTWEIVDESGNVYGSGGPYSNNTQYNETAYVAIFPSCFEFKLYDSYGDGMCCANGVGAAVVTDQNGNIIFEGDPVNLQNFNEIQVYFSTGMGSSNSWECTPFGCADVGMGNGSYATQYDCESDSSNVNTPCFVLTSINEITNNTKQDNKMYDVLGRELNKISVGTMYIRNQRLYINK